MGGSSFVLWREPKRLAPRAAVLGTLVLTLMAVFAIGAAVAQAVTPAVSAGDTHAVGLRSDGTVLAAGDTDRGGCEVSGWSGIKSVAAGWQFTVGLRDDGTVVATGADDEGQCDVAGWTGVTAVAAGRNHTVALKSDGTLVATGLNDRGQCDVTGWTDIVAVACGDYFTVGLKADGTVVAAGDNRTGECEVAGLSDVVGVACGSQHVVYLMADHTVAARGDDEHGQCDVSTWSGITAISAGYDHSLGVRSDRTVVSTGDNADGECDVAGWADIVAVSGGGAFTVGERSDGTAVAVGRNNLGQCDVGSWRLLVDTTPPVTTISGGPFGVWTNSDPVMFSLTATDGPDGSGVVGTQYALNGGEAQTFASSGVPVSDEGVTAISYWSVDAAGNAEPTQTATVLLDKTAPTITAARTPAPNANGWNNTNVTVHFDASDALSGLAMSSADTVISSEGAARSVTGSALDNAGNTSVATVDNINIDKTAPNIWINSPAQGATYYVHQAATCQWRALDSMSGPGEVSATSPDGAPIDTNSPGTHTFSVAATDLAGNASSRSVTYNVVSAPVALPSPSYVWFGDVMTGVTATRTVVVTNAGDQSLRISSRSIASCPGLSVSGPATSTLVPGASVSYLLTYKPTAVGTLASNLTVTSNDPLTPTLTVPIVGSAVARPAISASVTKIAFGNVHERVSLMKSVTISNTGSGDLVISSAGLVPGLDDVAVTGPTHTTLVPGASVTYQLTFAPSVPGAVSSTFTVTSNDPGTPSLGLGVTGTGLASSIAMISPSTITFDGARVGVTTTKIVTIRNLGDANLTMSSRSIAAATGLSVYGPGSATVLPGGDVELLIGYQPTAAGSLSSTLTVNSNDPVTPAMTVPISGTAVP